MRSPSKIDICMPPPSICSLRIPNCQDGAFLPFSFSYMLPRLQGFGICLIVPWVLFCADAYFSQSVSNICPFGLCNGSAYIVYRVSGTV